MPSDTKRDRITVDLTAADRKRLRQLKAKLTPPGLKATDADVLRILINRADIAGISAQAS